MGYIILKLNIDKQVLGTCLQV